MVNATSFVGPGLVWLEDVPKEYPSGGKTFRAVNDVSMDVYEDESVLTMGPSGSGKT